VLTDFAPHERPGISAEMERLKAATVPAGDVGATGA
jgi:hypothetical protein